MTWGAGRKCFQWPHEQCVSRTSEGCLLLFTVVFFISNCFPKYVLLYRIDWVDEGSKVRDGDERGYSSDEEYFPLICIRFVIVLFSYKTVVWCLFPTNFTCDFTLCLEWVEHWRTHRWSVDQLQVIGIDETVHDHPSHEDPLDEPSPCDLPDFPSPKTVLVEDDIIGARASIVYEDLKM